jgi:DNA-binding transcriptional ArsR family regulator
MRILELLEHAGGKHLTAEEIYRELVMHDADIGLATVYRVLTQFEAAGLVIKHNFEAGHAVYELERGKHHDHMVDVEVGQGRRVRQRRDRAPAARDRGAPRLRAGRPQSRALRAAEVQGIAPKARAAAESLDAADCLEPLPAGEPGLPAVR